MKSTKAHKISFLFCVILAALAFAVPGYSSSSTSKKDAKSVPATIKEVAKTYKPEKLRIAYSALSAMQSIPWIAYDAGLFEKYGLNVELTNASSSVALQAILSGDMPLAESPQVGSLQANLNGADTIIIANILEKSMYSLIVNKSIKTSKDLKGKRLGITSPGGTPDALTRKVLKLYGLNPDKDVTLVQLQDMGLLLAAMVGGSIDGACLSVPHNVKAKTQGFYELLDLNTLKDPIIGGAMVTSRKYLNEHRDIIKRFMMAYVEGIHRYLTDPEFSINVIKKWTRSDNTADIKTAHEEMAQYILKTPRTSVAGVQVMLDDLANTTPAAKTADPKRFFDTSVLDELEKDGFISKLYEKQKGR